MQSAELHPTAAGRPVSDGPLALILFPGLAILAIGTVMAADQGGFGSTIWYPAALIVLALSAVVVVATRPRPSETWIGLRGAILAFAAYVGWSYLSILWADIPSRAWDGANRSLLYLLVFALITLRPWPARAGRWGVGIVIVAVAGIAGGELIATVVNAHPAHLFIDGRLSSPTGYSNATPNLWLIGGLPALWLACDLALPVAVRGLLAATGTGLVELCLLSQSRGSVLGLVLGAVMLLSVAWRRWPALLTLGTALGATALSWHALNAVQDAAARPGGPVGSRLYHARVAILVSVVVVGILAALAAQLDRRVAPRLGSAAARRGNRAFAGLVALVAIAAVVGMGNPSTWVHDRWKDFTSTGDVQAAPGQTRLNGSLGSHRYDIYRVGLNIFLDHPIKGIGVDSFGPTYLVKGRTGEQPHYAHSLAISLLAETGVVGGGLFLAFLTLALRAGIRAARRRRSVAAVGGLAGFAVFVGGSLVDWLWQFPGLGVLAFFLLGVAAVSDSEPLAVVADQRRASAPAARRALTVAAGVAAALSLVLPAISARFTSSAYGLSAHDPAAAVAQLKRAADLDPVSADPLLAQAIIERRMGDLSGARRALGDAIGREPDNWFAYFERGMVESRQALWAAADRDLARARSLNPRQPVIAGVARVVAARRPADPEKAERDLAAQLQGKLHPLG